MSSPSIDELKNVSIGIRINPEIGYSEYLLSDTTSKYSRLGVKKDDIPLKMLNIGRLVVSGGGDKILKVCHIMLIFPDFVH